MIKNIISAFGCILIVNLLAAQDLILPLFPEGIPCENELTLKIYDRGKDRSFTKVHRPELVAYFPEKSRANGTSVIICPGGGYAGLAWDKEGAKIAEWFTSFGVTGFVLKYRLPKHESTECSDKVALQDAQRAMRLVRSKAKEWDLDMDRVGIMGFSAGGHLASTISTHFDKGNPNASLEVEKYACRPDFSILMYPVISMQEGITHKGSKNNLIGANPNSAAVQHFSNELQVTAETPPTLLIHANDDKAVLPENSVQYYLALRKHQIPATLHIFEGGGHGFGLAKGRGITEEWSNLCKGWLNDRGLLKKKIKVLIVDGQNNHRNWQDGTQIMKKYLEETDLFQVSVASTPSKENSLASFRPNFAAFDVVLSNYNGADWPAETQKDFEKFVYNGGSFVTIHAADNAFPNWKAYNEMIGLGGWEKRNEKDGPYLYYDNQGQLIRDTSAGKGGHHGRQHEFVVQVRNPNHPITKGMPEKWLHTKDELYDQLRGPAKNVKVLLSAYSATETGGTGRHEPSAMTVHYGYGRVFHTTMGHGNYSQHCVGFITLLQRGTEWAATGEVTQEIPKEFPNETQLSSRSGGPFMATGFDVLNIGATSATISTRLTKSIQLTEEARSANLSKMDIVGQEGEIKIAYRAKGTRKWLSTDWVKVTDDKNYTHSFQLKDLEAGNEYALRVECRAKNGEDVTYSLDGKFKTL